MAHCHPNAWVHCPVCDSRIFYGDEAPPEFCSNSCEDEFRMNFSQCPKCKDHFWTVEMLKDSHDVLYCVSCFEGEDEE